MCTKLSTVGGAQLQSPQHAMEAQVRAQSTRGTVAVAARKARAAAGAFRAPGTGLMHSELEHDLSFSRPWKCVDFEGRPGGALSSKHKTIGRWILVSPSTLGVQTVELTMSSTRTA